MDPKQQLTRASESRPKLPGVIDAGREKKETAAGNESDGSEYWNGDDSEETVSLASDLTRPGGAFGEATMLPSQVSAPAPPEIAKESSRMELTFDSAHSGGKSEVVPTLFEHEKGLQEEIRQKKKLVAKAKQAGPAHTVEQGGRQPVDSQIVSNLRRLSQGVALPRRTSGTSAFASAIRRRSSSAADHVGEVADDPAEADDPALASLASLYNLNISDVQKLFEKLHPDHDAFDNNGDEEMLENFHQR